MNIKKLMKLIVGIVFKGWIGNCLYTIVERMNALKMFPLQLINSYASGGLLFQFAGFVLLVFMTKQNHQLLIMKKIDWK